MPTALSWQPAAHFPLPVLGRCLGRSRRKVGYARGFFDWVLSSEPFGAGEVHLHKTGTIEMLRQSSSAIASNLREIDGRLRALEGRIHRIGSVTSTNAARAADGIGEAVASALSSMAARMRENATSVGNDAARFGNDAMRRLSHEAENRPLFMLAVAAGVGLLIGLSIHRNS
jgi:ElaB/YqjD/DUF883 family membrane-anchored ribosome-binding protein